MPEERTQQQHSHPAPTIGPISWWSWRPGIKPRNALIIGGLINLLALLLGSIGLVTLILGILDSTSLPVQVPAIIVGHSVNSLDGQFHITVRLHMVSFPDEISPVVSSLTYHELHNGSTVLLDYSPHLHLLYALESAGKHYVLPGASIISDLFGSLALLLIGGILLPYPAVLMSWGWRDLFGTKQAKRQCRLKARVVGLRASVPTRAGRTGLVLSPARAWYGVALYPLEVPDEQQVQTFAVSQELYRTLHEGAVVQITYSTHVHYVFALEQIKD